MTKNTIPAEEVRSAHIKSIRGNGLRTVMLSVLLLCSIFSTSFAQSKKELKNAQREAAYNAREVSTLLYLDNDLPPEQQSYLLPRTDIYVSDKAGLSIVSTRTAMIPPGTYTLGVCYEFASLKASSPVHETRDNLGIGTWHTNGPLPFGSPVYAALTFEPGKCYTLAYEKPRKTGADSVSIRLAEVTDSDILENADRNRAKVREYLSWSEANPGFLEGTYAAKHGKHTISFEDDRLRVTKYISGFPSTVEGQFFYNNETIIIIMETMQSGKTEPIKHEGIVIWHYMKNGDVISLLESPFAGAWTHFDYIKSNQ